MTQFQLFMNFKQFLQQDKILKKQQANSNKLRIKIQSIVVYNKGQQTMNYIDKIVNLIIRPIRDQYHIKRLGDPQMNIYTQKGEHIKVLRQDRIILNKHNQHIHLSYYAIQSINTSHLYQHSLYNKNTQKLYLNMHQNLQSSTVRSNQKVQNYTNKCVIYLHANNGSRLQGTTYLQKLIQAHCNVCLFDCSGSGMSQGQYVTLGLKQARDLDCIVNFLIKQKKVAQIILWGRSMGAATAIIYGSKHSKVKICGMVLDSPFRDLQKLILQIASDKTGFPKIFFQPLIPFIRSQIMNKTGYNIEELKLKRYIGKDANLQTSRSKKQINQKQRRSKDILSSRMNVRNKLSIIPVLFVVSKKDKFVRCSHGQKLFNRYKCEDKQIMYIDTEHHQIRSQNNVNKIINFIVSHFNQSDQQNRQQEHQYPLKFNKNVLARSRLDSRRTLQKSSQMPKVKISLNKYNPNTSIYSPSVLQNYHNSFKNQLNTYNLPSYQKDYLGQNRSHVTFSMVNPNTTQNLNQNNYKKQHQRSEYLINYKKNPTYFPYYQGNPPYYQGNSFYLNKDSLINQSIVNLNSSQIGKSEQNQKLLRHQFSNQSFSTLKNTNQMSSISYIPPYNKREENFNHNVSFQISQQQTTIPHYLDKNTSKYMNKGKISLASMLSQQEKVKSNKINIKQPYLSLSKVSYQPFQKYKSQNQKLSVKNDKQLIRKERQKYDQSLKTSIVGHSQIANNYRLNKDQPNTQNIYAYSTHTYKSIY